MEHRLYVGVEQTFYLRQLVDETQRYLLSRGQHLFLSTIVAKLKAASYLTAQQAVELFHAHANEVLANLLLGLAFIQVVRKDDALRQADDTAHLLYRR